MNRLVNNLDVNNTEPLLRGSIRIAPGATRCDMGIHSFPTTEWLNVPIVNYSFAFNHCVVAVTNAINLITGFHPALITLNHSVVNNNILI